MYASDWDTPWKDYVFDRFVCAQESMCVWVYAWRIWTRMGWGDLIYIWPMQAEEASGTGWPLPKLPHQITTASYSLSSVQGAISVWGEGAMVWLRPILPCIPVSLVMSQAQAWQPSLRRKKHVCVSVFHDFYFHRGSRKPGNRMSCDSQPREDSHTSLF